MSTSAPNWLKPSNDRLPESPVPHRHTPPPSPWVTSTHWPMPSPCWRVWARMRHSRSGASWSAGGCAATSASVSSFMIRPRGRFFDRASSSRQAASLSRTTCVSPCERTAHATIVSRRWPKHAGRSCTAADMRRARDSRSYIVMEEIKESLELHLPEPGDETGVRQ